MVKVYILDIKDNDDNFIYETLVFTSKRKYEKAKEIIEKFDDEYYYEMSDEQRDNIIYYDELMGRLEEKNLLGVKTEIETIFVR